MSRRVMNETDKFIEVWHGKNEAVDRGPTASELKEMGLDGYRVVRFVGGKEPPDRCIGGLVDNYVNGVMGIARTHG